VSPVLRSAESIERDPAKKAVFSTAAAKLVPDPAVYSTWFDRADERRRRIAVGSRRYSAVHKQLGAKPSWEHFLDPATGGILPLPQLQAETPAERAARVQTVRKQIAFSRQSVADVATFGYVPPKTPASVPMRK
jgi:hypothetical protein